MTRLIPKTANANVAGGTTIAVQTRVLYHGSANG